ncbi:DUF6507 family protein [Nocardiopsis exhalans]|uniref:DUF6507 family protein n=1 Tax=Nocardiopsis exhalans TaxID=163604 RepID=A0ABY5DBM0_9ACTN|nr:DUF6507 family protein [Nocardiopsis exhalans]USY20502.1 DUF6507 family protein [Nocardiopsis exhalans]
MSSWDIDPVGISIALTNVQTDLGAGEEGGGLSESAGRVDDQLDRALMTAKSALVEVELMRFMNQVQTQTSNIFLHGLSCVTAAGEATQLYIDGDQEMALESQKTAGNIENLGLEEEAG